ncbi:hypothetical protein MSG28_016042 [Choristoneura fumiferana]|uniref:Uncharacterized protein n=1 Tax=Choristoneura fumiferana TaxID=7141 RepID=A0ACC0K554_CHOFU|nr:hypothetical protein MSG28_016042 [Choristoneura fumiferana]
MDQLVEIPKLVDQLAKIPTLVDQLAKIPTLVDQLAKIPTLVDQLTTTPTLVDQLAKIPTLVDQLTTIPKLVAQLAKIPKLVNQLTTTPKLVTQLAKIPKLVNQLTTTPKLVTQLAKIPKLVDQLTTTPKLVAQLAKIPKLVNQLTTTPKLVTQLAKIPKLVNQLTTTPKLVTQLAKIPKLVDQLTTTPKLVAQLAKIPKLVDQLVVQLAEALLLVGSVDLGGLISGVLKGIFGVGKLVSTVLTDLVNIKVTAFVQVINLVVKVSLGIGGILNSVIVGLGSILSRIVAVIFKIGICINKFPGDNSICTKEWNAQFGVNGDASTAEDMFALFRVSSCKTDIESLINTSSNGKGITAFSPSIQICLQRIIDLSEIINSKTITKQHFSTCFVSLFTIFGSITNSYKQNSGTEITQKVFPVCGKYFVQQGYPDVSTEQQTIVKVISGANNDNFDWTSGKAITGSGQTTVVAKGDGLVTDIKDLFKIVKNDKQSTVTAVLNLEIPRSFNGVIVLCIKVIQALGSIIDLFFSGLGSLLVRSEYIKIYQP